MRKIFHYIHLWLSIPFGIIISVICLSGAILVFEKEITEMIYPETYHQMSHGRKGKYHSIGFFKEVRKLHRWMMDAPQQKGEKTAGKMVVGVSTMVMVFIIVSGIAVWVPRTSKALKNRLKVSTNKGWRRFWYDSHVSIGIYVSVFLLIMALTGLTWSFHWCRDLAFSLFGGPGTRRLLYSIHTGEWGGLTTKVIYFVSALAGGILPLSGYYLWLKKKLKRF